MATKERFFIIVRAPNGDVREAPLDKLGLVIGRDESADVRVDDKKVSRRHAAFKVVDGKPTVEDLESANGVRLNGKRIRKRAVFGHGDKIRVGGFYITLKEMDESTGSSLLEEEDRAERNEPIVEVRPVSVQPAEEEEPKQKTPASEESPVLYGVDDPIRGGRFVVQPGENIIGRLEECNVPVLDGSVSRQHARIVFARGRLTVTDLDSSNGTFVNDQQIDMAELADGDVLRTGNINFRVQLPPALAKRASGHVRPRKPRRPSTKTPTTTTVPWLLGAAGLLLAAVVIVGAVYYRSKNPSWPVQDPHLATLDAGTMIANVSIDGGSGHAVPQPDDIDAGVVIIEDTGDTEEPLVPKVEKDAGRATPPPKVDSGIRMPRVDRRRSSTSTSPFTRRDQETGMPLNLPKVEVFDFEKMVMGRLEEAKACEQKRDYACMQKAVVELHAIDPINAEGYGLLEKAEKYQSAQSGLALANRHIARGDFAEAYRVLKRIREFEDVPQNEEAKKLLEEILERAMQQEVRGAKRDRKSGAWKRAHTRYLFVLEEAPQEMKKLRKEAAKGISIVERKLRRLKVDFKPFDAPVRYATEKVDHIDAGDVLEKRYKGERALIKVAQLYRLGKLKQAKRKAKSAGTGKRKKRARKIREAIIAVEKIQSRTKTEIANDPSQAWSFLKDLVKREREILPKGVESYVVQELKADIADAFANRGKSWFDQGQHAKAYQNYESGYKLDRKNDKVLAGLRELENLAKKELETAHLEEQRGVPKQQVCDRLRKITRITSPSFEINNKAKKTWLKRCAQ